MSALSSIGVARGPVGMNSGIHSSNMLSYKSQIYVSNILSSIHFMTFFLLINIRMSPVKFVWDPHITVEPIWIFNE